MSITYVALNSSLNILCVRMNLLVRATREVIPLVFVVSRIVLYVYDRWSSLSLSRLVLFR